MTVRDTLLDKGLVGPRTTLGTDLAAAEADIQTIEAAYNKVVDGLLNGCFGSAGLAEGTNANTFKTVNDVYYTIAGVMYKKAATDNIAMTAAAQQADATKCIYLVEIDANGTVSTQKGTEVAAAATATPPTRSASKAVLGWIQVVNSGGTFTAGSTDLGAGTVTDTYVNLGFFTTSGHANEVASISV